MSIGENYLSFTKQQFRTYKLLAERAMHQIPEEKLFVRANDDTNSIAMIVQHMSGNMLSRWTDFLTTDGEKEWRQRDAEFEPIIQDASRMMEEWEKGWNCLFNALEELVEEDLEKIIYIRQEPQTVLEAINRQLVHYPYHVGQIIYAAKIFKDGNWDTLSMPKKK